MIRVECTYVDFDYGMIRELRTKVLGLPEVLEHRMRFNHRELADGHAQSYIIDSLYNQLARHITQRFGSYPQCQEWLNMLSDQLRRMLFSEAGPAVVPPHQKGMI